MMFRIRLIQRVYFSYAHQDQRRWWINPPTKSSIYQKMITLIYLFLQYSSVVVQLLLKRHYVTFNTQYRQKMDQCILF